VARAAAYYARRHAEVAEIMVETEEIEEVVMETKTEQLRD
jgi:Tfp pilus assembly pilus retraction ATPase PilT